MCGVSLKNKLIMKSLFFVLFICLSCICYAQITCNTIQSIGTKYSATAFKHGKGKLLPTDSAITQPMQQKTFELKKVSELSAEEKAELAKYKIKLNESDTVMFYDWDIIHNGKVGYFGPAVASVRFSCADSMIYTRKFLLNKETDKHVPNQFKIIRMNQSDFILNDRMHPYMNVNYYFKK